MNHKSKTNKFVAGLLGVTLVLSLAVVATGTAKADTVSDLTAQINSLLATVSSLQAKLSTLQGGSTSAAGYTFSKNLTVGSRGADVMNLQKVLNMSADTQVAASGVGSPGNEGSYFGPATKAAVIKFQKKYAISPAAGYVGALTRAQLATVSAPTTTTTSSGSTTTTTTSGTTSTTVTTSGAAGTLTVSSPTQPSASLAPYKASRVPFTKITLTAGASDVTVNSVTIQRTGLAQDAVFNGVVLLDPNGNQLGVAKTFNSNHQATIGDVFTVKAGSSVTMSIAGNMETTAGGYAGQVASISVIGINTSAAVSGSLPIVGAAQTINETLTLGTTQLAVSSYDPNSAQNEAIGTTGFRFSGIRVTAGSAEDVTLWSVRWNQSGSAASGDLANIVTVVDGKSYPTTISSDGKYYTTTFPNGVVIAKGFNKDIYVQGDIVGTGAANRTVQFDLYQNTDVYLTGNTYGYGIIPTAGANTASSATTASEFITSDGTTSGTASNPFFSGSTATIQAGTVTTISKSNNVPAQYVAPNVPSQILGGYDMSVKGEPISVNSTVFRFTYGSATASSNLLTSVSLVDENGAVVAGPVDAVNVAAGQQKVTFTDTVTYPLGTHTFTLKGKIPSTVTNTDTIVASTTPSSDWTTVKGTATGNTISLSSLSTAVSLNTMTVKTGALVVSASANPSAQTIVAGVQKQTFTNFQLDASQSGEDVRFSSIGLKLTASAANTDGYLASCQLYNGSTSLTTGSNVVNPTNSSSDASGVNYTFTFDNSLQIPKGTVVTLALNCNTSGSTPSSTTYHWDTQTISSTNPVVTGVTSGSSITATGGATGNTMTIGTGSLAASVYQDPGYQVVASGVTGVTLGSIKFRPTNEGVNLQRLGLQLTNTASSSSSDLVRVTIWNGSTQIGTAVFTGSNTQATSTFASSILLPANQDTVLTLKGDLTTIGYQQAVAVNGHLIAVDIVGNTNTQGTGASSGLTINATGSTAFSGVRVFKSYPVLAIDTLPGNGVADGRLMRFKVTAASQGPITIAKFLVNLSTSSATVNNVNIYGFSDSAYSQPIGGVNTGGQLLQTSVSTGNLGYANSPNIAVYPQTTSGATTTIQVPAGTTYYFEIRGTVTAAASATNYSVVTTLKGDSAYPLTTGSSTNANNTTSFFMTTIAGTSPTPSADAGGNSTLNSFLWSPDATVTSAVGDVDWTNGYGLPGLPSNGLINSRTN